MVLKNTEFIWAYSYDMIFDGLYPTPFIIFGLLVIILTAILSALDTMKEIQYKQGFKLVLSFCQKVCCCK